MVTIREIPVSGYEKVIEVLNPDVRLHGFIAIHNTKLGPALGGLRIHTYAKPEAALEDVLRLSKGMTYKSALAKDGLGGGKGVIIANPRKEKTAELLMSFGEAINLLKGAYITAEDVGSTPDDMLILKKVTPYVCALPTETSSGDPGRFTAWGVYRGILEVCKKLFHSHSVRNKRIAIMGLGDVGSHLAETLFWEGAELILCEVDHKKLETYCRKYGAEAVTPEDFFKTPCDILAPCALGGIFNDQTIPQLRCKAIAGSANNQLLHSKNGYQLFERGILYCPDYVINAGGIINVASEFDEGGYNARNVREKVNHIYDTLREIFDEADKLNCPPFVVADKLAEHNLEHGIGKRKTPIHFN